MPIVGIRELSRHVSGLVGVVERTREPVVVTRHGRAVALIVPVDAAALEGHVLASAPEFTGSISGVDRTPVRGAPPADT